ncbi:MAG: hypothetical protein ACJA1F_001966 [Paracoccaceae bacterium]
MPEGDLFNDQATISSIFKFAWNVSSASAGGGGRKGGCLHQSIRFSVTRSTSRIDLVDDFCSDQADDPLCQRIVIGAANNSDREVDLCLCQALGMLDRWMLRSAAGILS